MPALTWIVEGDSNAEGGIVAKSLINLNVFINGLSVSVMGDPVSPHGKPPLPGVTVASQTKVFIKGTPIILATDSDTPYAIKRLPSSSNTTVFSL